MLTGFGTTMEVTGEKPTAVDFVVGKPVTIDGLRTAVARAVGLRAPNPDLAQGRVAEHLELDTSEAVQV